MQNKELNIFVKDKNNVYTDIHPDFVTGLFEAEGSFSITKKMDNKSKHGISLGLRFKLTMLENESSLLEAIKLFFKCGNMFKGKDGSLSYIVKDIDSINNKIIPHFNNYPLRGTKYLDFISFKEALYIIYSKRHLTLEGINEILELSKSMNTHRNIIEEYSPMHTNADNTNYIPINGHYINGFIAGDGCLSFNIKDKNFGRMSLQISQHNDNILLINSIASYFKSPSKVYYHDINSIQLTLSGSKLWETIIFDHFIKYPLYGTKTERLKKLFLIRELTLDKKHLIKKDRCRIWDPKVKSQIIIIWNS